MFASSQATGGIENRPPFFWPFMGTCMVLVLFSVFICDHATVRCFARPFWAVDVFLYIYPGGHSDACPLMYVSLSW